jgi:hypothetical protein
MSIHLRAYFDGQRLRFATREKYLATRQILRRPFLALRMPMATWIRWGNGCKTITGSREPGLCD